MRYVFVCYVYKANTILVHPITHRTDEQMVATYANIYEYLDQQGFKPKLNVTDNECSKAVKNYMKKKDLNWQLVEPDNHRVNAAKRAIQTFKNHFIAGLACVD